MPFDPTEPPPGAALPSASFRNQNLEVRMQKSEHRSQKSASVIPSLSRNLCRFILRATL